ncbi:hypothetical protein CTAYLR_010728 [Chrysophaeum taylorii]|uniref:EF-hand domain-containing protein n=1 Tax=Chrysophaeum taylorii TaxID=2483200 RepID=A0AAD7UHH2_9STRA|nr:hypothetical protein CTAYLR_010728 [Chrysophaeum taylorii]
MAMRLYRILLRPFATPSRRMSGLADEAQAAAFVEKLSKSEFDALVVSCGRRLVRENPIDAECLMAKADKNDDGVLDATEFLSFWRRQGPRMLLHSAAAGAEPPSARQLRRLAVISAIPCIIFGFLDNSIMLVAGDAIDSTIGLKFGLSAMACAAFGNVIADATGQLSGGTVDAVLRPYLPNPRLTTQQQTSGHVRATHTLASTLGIIVGCLAGCAPLLFLNTSATSPSQTTDDGQRASHPNSEKG